MAEWAGMVSDTYGLHLMLRIAAIEQRAALGDTTVVNSFLRTLVDRVGMSILAGPVVATEDGAPERAGVSGVVILRESHAAVHTYPALGEAFVDVFSCRWFVPDAVLGVLHHHFGEHHVKERRLQTRGRHWDTDVAKELSTWSEQRARQAARRPGVHDG